MLDLGHNHIDSVTVRDGYTHRSGYNYVERDSYTAVSFVEGEGSPNLWLTYHPSNV
jgi:hypothetical protein